MGVLVATVRFTGTIPTSTELVAALCQHISELVGYEEELYALTCLALKDGGRIFAIADPPKNVWELRTGHLKGNYFWYASLIVLEKLGGEQLDFDGKGISSMSAPAWAYKQWRFARKEYRWRNWRKPSWLTLDEARRLGVE